MSAITKPQRKHQAMMQHCLRYLVGRRCCAWKFDYQEWPGEIVILSDADWASDSERRRSVDCVHIDHGGHLIEASTSTHSIASFAGRLRASSSVRPSCSSASRFDSGYYLILQRHGL